MALTVLLFEDNQLLRESITSLLNSRAGFHLTGALENAQDVKNQIKEHKPDIILMDIDMPGITGIEAVKIIRRQGLEIPIIMLTVFDDNVHVLNAIYAGASGYILKKHLSDKLFDAMEDVLTGGAPMSPSVARMVITSMHQQRKKNNYNLTPRESEILTSLSKGNSYKLIASELEISMDTVRTHIKKIYEKLQVHSQTEAVSKAINERLV